jgi:hypothetical protein
MPEIYTIAAPLSASGAGDVEVAGCAFGMGIDKPNAAVGERRTTDLIQLLERRQLRRPNIEEGTRAEQADQGWELTGRRLDGGLGGGVNAGSTVASWR